MLRKILFPCLSLALLAGCSTSRVQHDQEPVQTPETQVKHQASESAQDAVQELPPAALEGEMMFRLLVAEMAGRKGNLEVALVNYLAAAKVSTDPRVAERATRIAVYARANDHAMQAAARWSELAPESIEAHQVLATLHIRSKNVDGAVVEMQQVIALTAEGTANGISIAAALLERETDHQTTQSIMQRLAEIYSAEPNVYYNLASLARRNKQREVALQALDDALKLQPDYSEALVLRARLLSEMGRAEEAFQQLSAAVARQPNDVSLRMGYTRLLVEAGQFDTAAVELRILYADNKENSNLVYALGLLAIESRRLDDAQRYMEQVLILGTRKDDASYYLGRISDNQREYEKAIYYYQNVTGGDNQLDAQIRIAEMMGHLGRVEEARAHLNKLRVLNPQANYSVRFYLAEAEILRQDGQYQEAVDLLSEALENNPGDTDVLYARALASEKLDRPDIFENDLQAVLEQEPDNAHALNALGYFLVDRTERLQEAEKYITRALELLPNDAAVIDSMGWLQYRLGNHQQALDYLRKAYERLEDAEIAAHLGEVLWVMGDQEAADKIWQQALQASPEDRVLLKVIDRFKQ